MLIVSLYVYTEMYVSELECHKGKTICAVHWRKRYANNEDYTFMQLIIAIVVN